MWVMNQVGHADSQMTTDVYNQMQQRARRRHGQALDALVQATHERRTGLIPTTKGHGGAVLLTEPKLAASMTR